MLRSKGHPNVGKELLQIHRPNKTKSFESYNIYHLKQWTVPQHLSYRENCHVFFSSIVLTRCRIRTNSQNSEKSKPEMLLLSTAEPKDWVHGFWQMTRSKPPNLSIKAESLVLVSLWMSPICVNSPVCVLCHQFLRIFLLVSEASTDTTHFKRIPSRCRATSAPPIPLKIDSTVKPCDWSLSAKLMYAWVWFKGQPRILSKHSGYRCQLLMANPHEI